MPHHYHMIGCYIKWTCLKCVPIIEIKWWLRRDDETSRDYRLVHVIHKTNYSIWLAWTHRMTPAYYKYNSPQTSTSFLNIPKQTFWPYTSYISWRTCSITNSQKGQGSPLFLVQWNPVPHEVELSLRVTNMLSVTFVYRCILSILNVRRTIPNQVVTWSDQVLCFSDFWQNQNKSVIKHVIRGSNTSI